MHNLKTPKFWYPQTHKATYQGKALAAFLRPVSWLYEAASRCNTSLQKKNTYIAHSPVICVGNVTVGGAGKTPTALSLLKALKPYYKNPFFVSKGYGGTLYDPTIVNHDVHTAHDVGDEALLLAQHATTIIGKDRAKTLSFIDALQNDKPDLIIMDDGYQNHSIAKQRNILVVNSTSRFGNEVILPAGPLRESIEDAVSRADLICIIGDNEKSAKDAHEDIKHHLQDKPVLYGIIKVQNSLDLNARYIGFTALATPEKFKSTLREQCGITLSGWHEYPDHYVYTADDLTKLWAESKDNSARLITTEKDATKLPGSYRDDPHLDIVKIDIEWSEPEILLKYIHEKITL